MLGSVGSAIITVGILLALLLGGFILIKLARARFREFETDSLGGFTLQELRELHKQGKLSKSEYQAARKIILGNSEFNPKTISNSEPTTSTTIQQRPRKPNQKDAGNLRCER